MSTIHSALGEKMWSKLRSTLEKGEGKMPQWKVESHVIIYNFIYKLYIQIGGFIYYYSIIGGSLNF